jgi:hypothetical protein
VGLPSEASANTGIKHMNDSRIGCALKQLPHDMRIETFERLHYIPLSIAGRPLVPGFLMNTSEAGSLPLGAECGSALLLIAERNEKA